jgi:carbon storage regulator
MLVLTRKCGEAIVMTDANIVVTILELDGKRARIGVEAPPEVMIYRREVWERIRSQGKDADIERASPSASAQAADVLP